MDCILCGRRFDSPGNPCAGCGWNPDAVHEPLAGYRPGELVRGRYEVETPIGVGRLGAVFRATDIDSDSPVAVRVIHPALIPDEEAGRRFLKGVRSLIRVGHPFMNRVLDVNCEGNRYFAVYSFVDGVPLSDLIESRKNQGRSFTVDETVPILIQVAQLFVESELPCHGSLSPQNIVIMPEHIKVLDAGLAAYLPPVAVAHRLASRRRVRAWTPPELRRGHPPDSRTDVFACGALLGEMLTQIGFDGRPEVFIEMDPGLPVAVDAVLRRALLADPRGRYTDLRELLEALRDSGTPSVVAPVPRPATGNEAPLAIDDQPLLLAPDPPASSPATAPRFDWDDTSEMTMQVSMADVIRAHAEYRTPSASKETPLPLVRTSQTPPPPPAPPPAGRISVPPPAPPPRRVSTVPPPPRPAQRAPFVAPPPVKRFATLPPPPLAAARPEGHQPAIAPRRPQPLRRDSIPPSVFGGDRAVPPPAAVRADSMQHRAAPPPEVTQEIDLDALEPSTAVSRREVTQEIDARMIESVDRASLQSAVSKLEAEAAQAERASTEELIKHAGRLDGVDPRFVRAAHANEADRRGAHAKKAAEIIRERGEELDGIDPRLLRAAARLAEAQISEVSSVTAYPADPGLLEEEEGGDDWRERLAAQAEASVISFIAPPVTDRPHEVRGFPRTAQRRPAPAPPVPRGGDAVAPPPARPAGRRREPAARRALYDDSGETDDDSQPTIMARTSSLPPARHQAAALRRLDRVEAMLPLLIGLLLTAMAALLTLAAFRG